MNLLTATDTTGHNLAQSSCGLDLAGDEGAAEEADKEDSQEVEEEDPRPGCCRRGSRKKDDAEEGRGSKRQGRQNEPQSVNTDF